MLVQHLTVAVSTQPAVSDTLPPSLQVSSSLMTLTLMYLLITVNLSPPQVVPAGSSDMSCISSIVTVCLLQSRWLPLLDSSVHCWGFGAANQSPPETERQPRINELMPSVGKPLPLLEHIVPLTMLHLKVVKALLNLTDASSDDVGTLHSICAQHNDSRGYWVPDSKQKCQHLFLKMDFMSLRLCYHFLTKKYM